MDEKENMREVGLRIKGLREACDYTVEQMAAELDVEPDTLRAWEETGADVPISAIYTWRVCSTWSSPRSSRALPRSIPCGSSRSGWEVDRIPATTTTTWRRYQNKIMQPLVSFSTRR